MKVRGPKEERKTEPQDLHKEPQGLQQGSAGRRPHPSAGACNACYRELWPNERFAAAGGITTTVSGRGLHHSCAMGPTTIRADRGWMM